MEKKKQARKEKKTDTPCRQKNGCLQRRPFIKKRGQR